MVSNGISKWLTWAKLREQPAHVYGRSPVWTLKQKNNQISSIFLKCWRICFLLPDVNVKLIRSSKATTTNWASKWPLTRVFSEMKKFLIKKIDWFILSFLWMKYSTSCESSNRLNVDILCHIFYKNLSLYQCDDEYERPNYFVMYMLVRKLDINTFFCFPNAMNLK